MFRGGQLRPRSEPQEGVRWVCGQRKSPTSSQQSGKASWRRGHGRQICLCKGREVVWGENSLSRRRDGMAWGGSLTALLSMAGSDLPRGLVEMGWHIALLPPWHPGCPVWAIFLHNLNLRFPSRVLPTSESNQAGSAEALPWGHSTHRAVWMGAGAERGPRTRRPVMGLWAQPQTGYRRGPTWSASCHLGKSLPQLGGLYL